MERELEGCSAQKHWIRNLSSVSAGYFILARAHTFVEYFNVIYHYFDCISLFIQPKVPFTGHLVEWASSVMSNYGATVHFWASPGYPPYMQRTLWATIKLIDPDEDEIEKTFIMTRRHSGVIRCWKSFGIFYMFNILSLRKRKAFQIIGTPLGLYVHRIFETYTKTDAFHEFK